MVTVPPTGPLPADMATLPAPVSPRPTETVIVEPEPPVTSPVATFIAPEGEAAVVAPVSKEIPPDLPDTSEFPEEIDMEPLEVAAPCPL